jgi:threonine dehydratase
MVDLPRVREAHRRIRPHINRTPILTSSRLDAATGASLFFKCENFQKIGAFKARGATNAVFVLDEMSARRGVATHSSGNHAQALARAARLRRIPAHIVMPSNSSKVKISGVEGYGGKIIFCQPNETARDAACAEVIATTGATLIHPFENEDVIAGQGTAAVELLEEVEVDLVLCPVGGGGLLAGTAVAAKSMRPSIRVIAVEPENVDDAAQSFRAGKRIVTEKKSTIADGLRTNVGAPNFEIIQRDVDDIVTVSEDAIVKAMREIWQTMKIIVEPSAAVPLAAILDSDAMNVAGRRIGIILTGGNVDFDTLPWTGQ